MGKKSILCQSKLVYMEKNEINFSIDNWHKEHASPRQRKTHKTNHKVH